MRGAQHKAKGPNQYPAELKCVRRSEKFGGRVDPGTQKNRRGAAGGAVFAGGGRDKFRPAGTDRRPESGADRVRSQHFAAVSGVSVPAPTAAARNNAGNRQSIQAIGSTTRRRQETDRPEERRGRKTLTRTGVFSYDLKISPMLVNRTMSFEQ